MDITENILGHTVVLTLRHSVVSEPAIREIGDKIKHLMDRKLKFVILNMAEVTYVSSLGLGILVSSLTSLRRIGGDLRLVCLNASVRNSFVITQLTQVFQTFESEKEAVESFADAK